jgi:amino acid transporter
MNERFQVPIRAVWATGICAMLVGLIGLGGSVASGAIFSLAVVGQYVANATVISLRFLGGGEVFKPGPFALGKFVSLHSLRSRVFKAVLTSVE